MLTYTLTKLALAVPLLLGVALAVFLIGAVTPGDPVLIMLGDGASAGEAERLRSRLGLDLPWHVQYLHFVGRALQGDLGLSYRSGQPVFGEVMANFPATVELTAAAMAVAILVGVTLGALAALHHNSALDRLAVLVAVVGSSMPVFWSGLLLILLFSLSLGWLPASGRGTPQQLILPALTLGLGAAALLARLTRSSMLETLAQDYVRTARAKGIAERAVIVGHALRNAMVPVAAAIGLQVGALLAGAFLTETVFAWPGLGRLTVQAIEARDFPLLRGAVLLVAVVFTLVNLAVDLLFASLDPRIRYS
jgi:ABC-type dipeptide/oligopeptide/nickel transport system permease component